MEIIGRVISGIFFAGLGIASVVYARRIVESVGTSATLEKYLGSGGTYNGIRIIGSLVTIFSILHIFGFADDLVGTIVNFFNNLLFVK